MMPIFLWSMLVIQSRHSVAPQAEVGDGAEQRDAAERDRDEGARAGSARAAESPPSVRRPKIRTSDQVDRFWSIGAYASARCDGCGRSSGDLPLGDDRCSGDVVRPAPCFGGDVERAGRSAACRAAIGVDGHHLVHAHLAAVDAAVEDRRRTGRGRRRRSGARARARWALRASGSASRVERRRPCRPWPSATHCVEVAVAQAVELEAHAGEAGAAVVGGEALVARPAC